MDFGSSLFGNEGDGSEASDAVDAKDTAELKACVLAEKSAAALAVFVRDEVECDVDGRLGTSVRISV